MTDSVSSLHGHTLRVDPHLRCRVEALPPRWPDGWENGMPKDGQDEEGPDESGGIKPGDTVTPSSFPGSPLHHLFRNRSRNADPLPVTLMHPFLHSLRARVPLRIFGALVEADRRKDRRLCFETASSIGLTPQQIHQFVLSGVLVPDSYSVLWSMRREVISYFYLMTWGGLGDVVCTTPLFGALREALPDTYIHVVALGATDRQIADADPAVNATSTRADFDFDRGPRTLCFEPRVGVLGIMQTASRPITNIMADLLHLPLDSRSPCLYPSSDDRRRADALRKDTGPYVAVHTASRDAARNWPISSWAELIDDLDLPVVQVGGSDDPALPSALDRRGTPFLTSAAILERARAVVAVNSSMQHAAAAFDVPAVVLFGPSPPEIFSHAGHRAVQTDTCNCYRRLHEAIECDGPCVDAISPSDVRRALDAVLAPASAA